MPPAAPRSPGRTASPSVPATGIATTRKVAPAPRPNTSSWVAAGCPTRGRAVPRRRPETTWSVVRREAPRAWTMTGMPTPPRHLPAPPAGPSWNRLRPGAELPVGLGLLAGQSGTPGHAALRQHRGAPGQRPRHPPCRRRRSTPAAAGQSAWLTPGRMPQHWPHGTRETPTTRLPVTPMPNRRHPLRPRDPGKDAPTADIRLAGSRHTAAVGRAGLPDPALCHPRGTVELQLLLGDAATRLEGWHARHGSLGADSVFLDGFDPKKNPAMWDVRTMQAVARHCRPGTRIATWCVPAACAMHSPRPASGCTGAPACPPSATAWPGNGPTHRSRYQERTATTMPPMISTMPMKYWGVKRSPNSQ